MQTLIGAALLTALVSACGGPDEVNESVAAPEAIPMAATTDPSEVVIGLATQNLERSFFLGMVAGAERRADELGVELIVSDGLDDVAVQQAGVNELIEMDVDVLVLSPIDSVQAESMVQRAATAGVPVVAVANQVGSAEQYGPQFLHPQTVSLVTNDDVDMGRKAGLFVAAEVGAADVDIAVLAGKAGTANAVLRLEGFVSELDALGVNHEIVANVAGDWNADGGAAACESFASLESVEMIFSMSDAMTIGCVSALDAAGMDVPIVSIGGNADGIELLEAGRIVGSVCQKPATMGALAVDSALAAIVDGDLNQGLRFYDTPVVTVDSMDQCVPQW